MESPYAPAEPSSACMKSSSASTKPSSSSVEPSSSTAMKSPSASVTTAAALGKDGPWQTNERHKRDDHAENP